MDKKNIVVCSLNVNGLSKDKICYLKDFLMPHGVDIIFLQETHADSCELISFFERVKRDNLSNVMAQAVTVRNLNFNFVVILYNNSQLVGLLNITQLLGMAPDFP